MKAEEIKQIVDVALCEQIQIKDNRIKELDNINSLLQLRLATQEEAFIEKACKWLIRELAAPMPDELYKKWCNEKLVDFRNEMKGV